MHQRYIEILGISKLLPPIYQRMYIDSQTSVWSGKKRPEVKLDRETGRDVPGIEEVVYKKLVLAVPDLDKKNEDRSWCVRLCNR